MHMYELAIHKHCMMVRGFVSEYMYVLISTVELYVRGTIHEAEVEIGIQGHR